MSVIKAEEAPTRALYRLIKVLRAKLEDELAPLNDTNNTVPIPDDDGYFIGGSEEELTSILNSKGVGCFLYPLAPPTMEAKRTGDGTNRAMLHRSTVRVTFLFKNPGGYEDYKVEGYSVMPHELIYHLADRLRGACLLTIYKYAIDSDNIHEVEIIAQAADLVTVNNDTLTGRATLDIILLQDVQVPMPTYDVI